jgi:TetR/AcrR family transcriptional repressor of nem operon
MARTRDKAASHERIIRKAAAQVRRDGADRVSVASLMQEAGLTHGGFYRHFASREALIDEAITSALKPDDTLLDRSEANGDDPLTAYIDVYLSAVHRDTPESGCGVAALAGDVARGSAANKAAYARRAEANIESLAETIPGKADPDETRREAIIALSTMVGALVISRAAAGSGISDEILDTARNDLIDRYSPSTASPVATPERPRSALHGNGESVCPAADPEDLSARGGRGGPPNP